MPNECIVLFSSSLWCVQVCPSVHFLHSPYFSAARIRQYLLSLVDCCQQIQSDFQSGVNKQKNQLTRFDGPKSGPVLS